MRAKFKNVEVWNSVIESFQKHLSGWKRKILSKGERLVLAQSTLASLPIYHLSLLTIPSSIAYRLDKIVRDFLWGSCEEKRKIHLVAWENVCSQKEEGGLGLRKIKVMNQALLMKWLWRYGKEKNALWRKVIDAKYGFSDNGGRPSISTLSHGCSVWRSIQASQEVFFNGINHIARRGDKTRFWHDSWLGENPFKRRFHKLYKYASLKGGTVREHFDFGDSWNLHLRRSRFRESEQIQLDSLMNILLNVTLSDEDDEWAWKNEKNGLFSVKSCYEMLIDNERPRNEVRRAFPCKITWEPRIPTKVKFFMWTLNWDRILTVDKLQRRGLTIPNRCCLCNSDAETIVHLFIQCRFTRTIWEELVAVHSGVRHDMQNWRSISEMLLNWPAFKSTEVAAEIWAGLPYAVLWCIWRQRNEIIFNNGNADIGNLLQIIKATCWTWLNMSEKAMESRKKFKFTDLLFGWRFIMVEQ